MSDPSRTERLQHLVNRRYLTDDGPRAAYHGDAQHQWQIEQLRQMLVATDKAMAAEGFSQDARDRVVFRLLYGEAPETAYGDIDWRAAHKRTVERAEETIRLMSQPLPALPKLLLDPDGVYGEKW